MKHSDLLLALACCAAVSGCGDSGATIDGGITDPLAYHDGYWVTVLEDTDQPGPVTAINDMHMNLTTRRATVYAQTRAAGEVLSPPQGGRGECTEGTDGETVCFHPNAVYLNGSGRELSAADGSGAWWVKHSWIVDGEGYNNCPLSSEESYLCFWVEGVLLEDGLSMKIGGTEGFTQNFYNIRTPLLDEDPITYQITRYTPDPDFVLSLDCIEEVSAFDNQTRPCPVLAQ
jgi:hypothetical protein